MIAPMTKYSFILLSGEQEGLFDKLLEIGLVDVTRSVKPMLGGHKFIWDSPGVGGKRRSRFEKACVLKRRWLRHLDSNQEPSG